MNTTTTSAEFFEEKYQSNPDPWDFESSAYEQQRYDYIIKSLGARHFARGFEPGCSIGVLTEMLAPHCHRLEAIDFSATAVDRAREKCRRYPHVSIQCGSLPEEIPKGRFDLIVLSEIGFYFDASRLNQIVRALGDRLESGSFLIACHWLGASSDHILSGDEVHKILRGSAAFCLDREWRFPEFRLDRLVRR